jgi:hypothetical protein
MSMRDRSSSASSQRKSSSPNPHARSSSSIDLTRSRCVGEVMAVSVPPFTNSASIPSSAATRPTSSTVAKRARSIATAAGRPYRRAILLRGAANKPEHHPPLRPDAPKPATSFSINATRIPGCPRKR